mmetsp:Transcript_20874/g.43617  ORF Transcript_20874/g.43617 Transcript_20874/m.43617 type:complete len:265 (-) Transcript_20874:1635-2429(-)
MFSSNFAFYTTASGDDASSSSCGGSSSIASTMEAELLAAMARISTRTSFDDNSSTGSSLGSPRDLLGLRILANSSPDIEDLLDKTRTSHPLGMDVAGGSTGAAVATTKSKSQRIPFDNLDPQSPVSKGGEIVPSRPRNPSLQSPGHHQRHNRNGSSRRRPLIRKTFPPPATRACPVGGGPQNKENRSPSLASGRRRATMSSAMILSLSLQAVERMLESMRFFENTTISSPQQDTLSRCGKPHHDEHPRGHRRNRLQIIASAYST